MPIAPVTDTTDVCQPDSHQHIASRRSGGTPKASAQRTKTGRSASRAGLATSAAGKPLFVPWAAVGARYAARAVLPDGALEGVGGIDQLAPGQHVVGIRQPVGLGERAAPSSRSGWRSR